GVRRAAAEHILSHLGVAEAGPRLRMTIRMWITAVEAASLIWLDEDKQPPAGELRDWLVEQFVAGLEVTGRRDPQTEELVRALAAVGGSARRRVGGGRGTAPPPGRRRTRDGRADDGHWCREERRRPLRGRAHGRPCPARAAGHDRAPAQDVPHPRSRAGRRPG